MTLGITGGQRILLSSGADAAFLGPRVKIILEALCKKMNRVVIYNEKINHNKLSFLKN